MSVLNSLEHFNKYYELEESFTPAESLRDFFLKIVQPRFKKIEIKVLDLGSGSESIFEKLDLPKSNVTAIDFSDVAIKKAKDHFKETQYTLVDLSVENVLAKNTYDLVFDSHCLHCIEGVTERQTAFDNIRESLSETGIFCAEMMIRSGKYPVNLPYKFIPTATELETELLQYGFKILYFKIEAGIVFTNNNGECDLVRVVCNK
jgi:2-polyprenyl-3-methyl-5-hydroxy-6-metoxy-1,4-benzoquinol methylase